ALPPRRVLDGTRSAVHPKETPRRAPAVDKAASERMNRPFPSPRLAVLAMLLALAAALPATAQPTPGSADASDVDGIVVAGFDAPLAFTLTGAIATIDVA